MNYFKDVAKIFDLNLNEEFHVVGIANSFKFTEKGLVFFNDEDKAWEESPSTLREILQGYLNIVWKPKEDCVYYTYRRNGKHWEVFSTTWRGEVIDYLRLYSGVAYKTEEEAKENLEKDVNRLVNEC